MGGGAKYPVSPWRMPLPFNTSGGAFGINFSSDGLVDADGPVGGGDTVTVLSDGHVALSGRGPTGFDGYEEAVVADEDASAVSCDSIGIEVSLHRGAGAGDALRCDRGIDVDLGCAM